MGSESGYLLRTGIIQTTGIGSRGMIQDGMRRVGLGRRRLMLSLILACALGATFAIADPGARSAALERATAADRPNVLVIESDDQTVESMRVMHNVNSLIGAQGATFKNSFVNYSLCCPSRVHVPDRPVRAQPRRAGATRPRTAASRFEPLHANNNLAVWLQHAGYYTALIGKYLNEYDEQPAGPARLVGVARGRSESPTDVYDYTTERQRHADRTTATTPADFKQDVLTRKAVDFVDRRAPEAEAVLPLAHLHGAAQRRPGPEPQPALRTATARPKPAPRHAHAFDSEPLPRPPNFNEADVSDKPAAIRDLPAA